MKRFFRRSAARLCGRIALILLRGRAKLLGYDASTEKETQNMTQEILETAARTASPDSPELLALRETLDGIFAPVSDDLTGYGQRLDSVSAHFGESRSLREEYAERFSAKGEHK